MIKKREYKESIDSINNHTTVILSIGIDLHALATSFGKTGNTYIEDMLVDMSCKIIAANSSIKKIHENNIMQLKNNNELMASDKG